MPVALAVRTTAYKASIASSFQKESHTTRGPFIPRNSGLCAQAHFHSRLRSYCLLLTCVYIGTKLGGCGAV